MSLPIEGPCTAWCTWEQVLDACSGLDDDDLAAIDALSDAQKAEMIDSASSIAYDLTQHRYPGLCETTKTLCAPCSCALSACCCRPRSEIDLGRRFAIDEVSEVVIDGVALTPGTDYRVDRWRWLVRLGDESWPRCADIEDPDAFRATWTYGRMPTAGLVRGVVLFVVEMAKRCAGLKCELPQRITTVQREGTTFTIIDSMKMLDEGKTGFYALDAAIAADKRGRKISPGMLDVDGCTDRRAVDTGGS